MAVFYKGEGFEPTTLGKNNVWIILEPHCIFKKREENVIFVLFLRLRINEFFIRLLLSEKQFSSRYIFSFFFLYLMFVRCLDFFAVLSCYFGTFMFKFLMFTRS